jgi:large subunit ribosomal protein L24
MLNKLKIKKGDKVMIIAGKDKGKTGNVERVFLKASEVVVAGLNTVKKHVKVSKKYPSGGIVEIPKPLNVSKVAVVCPSCGKPTRIGYEIKGKEKNRVCKKCSKVITAKKETKE